MGTGASRSAVATDPITDDLAGATVVHRAGERADAGAVLDRCRHTRAAALVFISSARVYGASLGNDMQLDERADPATSFDDPDLETLAGADRVLAEAAGTPPGPSGPRVVVLRPVPVMEDAPTSPLAQALARGRLRTTIGFDPIVQVVHPDDVGSAADAALRHELHGVYNVCGPGALPLSVLARETEPSGWAASGAWSRISPTASGSAARPGSRRPSSAIRST